MTRLDRQIRYMEETQAILESTPVTVVGDGQNDAIAKDVLMQLALLGVNNISFLSDAETNKGEYLFGMELESGFRAESLQAAIEGCDPRVSVTPLIGHSQDSFSQKYFSHDHVVFDCSNSPVSKAYAKSKGSNVFALVGNHEVVGYNRFSQNLTKDHYFPEFVGQKQSPMLSMVVASFAVQDYVMGLKNPDSKFSERFWYRIHNAEPFENDGDNYGALNPASSLRNLFPLFVGAGAVGNAGLEMAARMGVKQGIVLDDDVIEDHNRHAQSYFFDISEDVELDITTKASVLTERVNQAYGSEFEPVIDRFWFDSVVDERVNLVATYVDRLFTRAFIDAFCVENELPQVYAASGTEAGSSAARLPFDDDGNPMYTMSQFFGLTLDSCKDELGIERTVLDESGGCGRQIFASLVPLNFLMGALSAHQMLFVHSPQTYGHVFPQARQYRLSEDGKLFVDNHFSQGIVEPGKKESLQSMYTDIMGPYA